MSNLGKIEKWCFEKKLSSGKSVYFVGKGNAIQLLHSKEAELEAWKVFYENLVDVVKDVFELLDADACDQAFGYLDDIITLIDSTPCVRHLPRYKAFRYKKGGKDA